MVLICLNCVLNYVQNYGALSALPVAEIPIWPKSEDNTVAMLTEHIEKTVFTFTGHTFTPSRGHVKHFKSKYGADAISEASVQSVPWSRPQLHTQVRHGTTSSTNHSAVLCAVERGVQVDRNKQEKVCIKAWCALTMTYTQDVHISADKIPKRKTCLKLVRSWNKGNARPHPNAACHRHHIWQETWPAETNHIIWSLALSPSK